MQPNEWLIKQRQLMRQWQQLSSGSSGSSQPTAPFQRQLAVVRHAVAEIHRRLVQGDDSGMIRHASENDPGIRQLKCLLQSTQDALGRLQMDWQLALDRLQMEETQLWVDVGAWQDWVVNQRPLSIAAAVGHVVGSTTCTGSSVQAIHDDDDDDRPGEVRAYEQFMRRYKNSISAGWSEEDHGAFVRLRGRYRRTVSADNNVDDVDDVHGEQWMRLVGQQTGRSMQEVQEHELFYAEWRRLNVARKEAIQRWRRQREAQSQYQSGMAEQALMEEEEQRRAMDEQEEQARKEQEEQRVKQRRQEQLEKKQAIQQWRQERERERLLAAEREMTAERERRELAERKKAAERETRLQLLLERKEKQELENRDRQRSQQGSRASITSHSHAPPDPELLRRRGEQAIEQARQKRQEQLRKEREEEEARRERLERAKRPVSGLVAEYVAKATADKERLFRPTRAMREREASSAEEQQIRRNAGGILDPREFFTPGRGVVGSRVLPKRHVPSWRQGL